MIVLQLRNRFVPARDPSSLITRQSRPRNAPTIVTIEHKNFLIEASSYPGPESEDSDEGIVLSTPPSQRTPATGSSPTPELGDTTHSFSPTHEPRNVDNSPLLSLSPLLHPPFSPINAPTPTATAADGSDATREASSTCTTMDNGSTQLSVGAPPFPPPTITSIKAQYLAGRYTHLELINSIPTPT